MVKHNSMLYRVEMANGESFFLLDDNLIDATKQGHLICQEMTTDHKPDCDCGVVPIGVELTGALLFPGEEDEIDLGSKKKEETN